MTTKEALIRARALIAEPKNWKQGGLAEVENGKVRGPYCSLGAIGKALEILSVGGGPISRTGDGMGFFTATAEKNAGNMQAVESYDQARTLLAECFEGEVHEYNDTHDHACVLAAFDRAIEKAE